MNADHHQKLEELVRHVGFKDDELHKLIIHTLIYLLNEAHRMAANFDALNASVVALDGEVDALAARVAAIPPADDTADQAAADAAQAAIDAIKAKVAAILPAA